MVQLLAANICVEPVYALLSEKFPFVGPYSCIRIFVIHFIYINRIILMNISRGMFSWTLNLFMLFNDLCRVNVFDNNT